MRETAYDVHYHVCCLDAIQVPAAYDASFCIGASSGFSLKAGGAEGSRRHAVGIEELRQVGPLVVLCACGCAFYYGCVGEGVHASMLTLFIFGFYYVQEALADEECCGDELGCDR